MNADGASGLLYGALKRIALHYGMIDTKTINAMGQDVAYRCGVKTVVEVVKAVSAQEEEKQVVARLLVGLQKRFRDHVEQR